MAVVRRFLIEDVGVDSLDVAPRDGSGLSAYNLVTPRAVVAVLSHMGSGPLAEVYRDALADPGEEGSTLEERLLDLDGSLFAKTGTISNVNSLSGYLQRGRRQRHHLLHPVERLGHALQSGAHRDRRSGAGTGPVSDTTGRQLAPRPNWTLIWT